MSAHIEVNMWYIFKQIIFVIFLPMIAGYITQQYLLKRYNQSKMQKEIAPKLSGISTLGVLGIVFIAMALKAKEIVSQFSLILYIFLPLFTLYTLNYFLLFFSHSGWQGFL